MASVILKAQLCTAEAGCMLWWQHCCCFEVTSEIVKCVITSAGAIIAVRARSQVCSQRRQEQFKAKDTCLKKAVQTALMLLMVTASPLNDTAIPFAPVYLFTSFT